jgi:hypothetical protein
MNLEREGGGKESNTPKCVQKVQEGSRQGSARMPHRMIMVSVTFRCLFSVVCSQQLAPRGRGGGTETGCDWDKVDATKGT